MPLMAAAPMPPSSLPREAPMRDGAGNAMAAFAPVTGSPADESDDHSAMRCTADRHLCAQLSRDVDANIWSVHLTTSPGAPAISKALPGGVNGEAGQALWPFVILEADGEHALIGVTSEETTGYSGGGASATSLSLYRVTLGAHPAFGEAVTLPVRGSALIRACFSEKHHAQRAGACHDDYQFAATVTLDPAVASGPPKLTYMTEAHSFPGKVSRFEDSLAKPRLCPGDLVWARDTQCSYRRYLVLDPDTGSYAPDAPLPDCEGYTVP